MEKMLFSRHIPFASLSQKDVDAIRDDIALFNRIKRTVTRRKSVSCASEEAAEKTTDKPDLRKKENAELRKKQPKSMHLQLKETFGTEDHFTNSARRSANAAIRSVKELKQMNLDRAESDVDDITAKIKEKKIRALLLSSSPSSSSFTERGSRTSCSCRKSSKQSISCPKNSG